MSTEYEDEAYAPPRPVLRASRVYQPPRTTGPAPQSRKRLPLLPLGLGMCTVVALLLIIQHVVWPSYVWAFDQWHYGDARLAQLDADVGHNGPSHFIAEYYDN